MKLFLLLLSSVMLAAEPASRHDGVYKSFSDGMLGENRVVALRVTNELDGLFDIQSYHTSDFGSSSTIAQERLIGTGRLLEPNHLVIATATIHVINNQLVALATMDDYHFVTYGDRDYLFPQRQFTAHQQGQPFNAWSVLVKLRSTEYDITEADIKRDNLGFEQTFDELAPGAHRFRPLVNK